jgi:methionyl-tRNA formyltransferase
MTKPLFAFFGTSHFAVVILDRLEARGLLPALIVTAPDAKQGRGLELKPSAVKEWALERGIDVVTPATLRDEVFAAELANSDWDVFVVAAYAKLIPQSILDIPVHGALNVHPSLLPKFRGPSPALSAILANERTSGVTIMQMDAELDHGPIVAQGRVELEAEDWPPRGSVYEDLLATEGGNLLAEIMPEWIAGEIVPEQQDHSAATNTKKFSSSDALIDLSAAPEENLRKIRAFDRNPRAYYFAEKGDKKIRTIITDAEISPEGTLSILSVIPEGKKEMSFADFMRG